MFKTLNLFSKVSFAWIGLMFFFAIAGNLLPIADPSEFFDVTGAGLFTSGHLLGTDSNGYDLLANVVVGSRSSLSIAVVSVGLGSLIGGILGIAAGYVRGKTDYVLGVVFNILLSIPNLILSLVLIAVLATNSDPTVPVPDSRRLVVIIISLTIVIFPILGRITRGSTLAWTNSEFVIAAKSMGMKDLQIIKRHTFFRRSMPLHFLELELSSLSRVLSHSSELVLAMASAGVQCLLAPRVTSSLHQHLCSFRSHSWHLLLLHATKLETHSASV